MEERGKEAHLATASEEDGRSGTAPSSVGRSAADPDRTAHPRAPLTGPGWWCRPVRTDER